MSATFRRGTMADLEAVYEVFVRTTADLEARTGMPGAENWWRDPAFVADYWSRHESLFAHLTTTAEQFWVAEQDGQIVGFARATFRDGVRELVEFFVLPECQNRGVGRELLTRAFPRGGAKRRVVQGTTDIRALSRYLSAGVYPRFPVYYFARKPEPVAVETDLAFVAVGADTAMLAKLREIDRAVIGFARDADHVFLSQGRQIYLFQRDDRLVGYGYFGANAGPIATMDAADLSAVIAFGETMAAEQRAEEFGLHVPLINRVAVTHLLGRRFRLDPFTVLFYSDEPFGAFDRYIMTSPDYII